MKLRTQVVRMLAVDVVLDKVAASVQPGSFLFEPAYAAESSGEYRWKWDIAPRLVRGLAAGSLLASVCKIFTSNRMRRPRTPPRRTRRPDPNHPPRMLDNQNHLRSPSLLSR